MFDPEEYYQKQHRNVSIGQCSCGYVYDVQNGPCPKCGVDEALLLEDWEIENPFV